MDIDESEIHHVSKRARLMGISIFLLMVISLFLHLCAFGNISLKTFDSQTNFQENKTQSINEKTVDVLFDTNILPFFCILAHLIWTIVPIVVLDQCCISNNKSIVRIVVKLFLCTCPLLLCSELSLLFLCHVKLLTNHFLMIIIKWFIFVATLLICFWTGMISDKDKWRGIHGGQIAPEIHSPLYRFEI